MTSIHAAYAPGASAAPERRSSIVHISTELRLAWRHGLEAAMAENSDEVVPYKIYGKSLSAMAAVASERLRLFNAG